MKIYYISYWGVKEGLSVATIFPNLRLLANMEKVTEIHYFTIERSADKVFKDDMPTILKVIHHPIHSTQLPLHLLTKIGDWYRIKSRLLAKARSIKPDVVICRGAMAGAFGTFLYKRLNIPYFVESFEPHADYMAESGVWKKGGIKYTFQRKKEQAIKRSAARIITVSHNYAEHLKQKEGIAAEKIYTVPCTVDLQRFAFDAQQRKVKREKLNLSNHQIVGVYVGKFGGIYYDDKAFELFKACFDFFGDDFFLILLTPTSATQINNRLEKFAIPVECVWFGTVAHAEVAVYLSAADFAFSTIKPADCRQFCSPIKDGEYWANGLPILIPDGIGDDSAIIQAEGGGVIIDLEKPSNLKDQLLQLNEIIKNANSRSQIQEIAVKHRHPSIGKKVYDEIID